MRDYEAGDYEAGTSFTRSTESTFIIKEVTNVSSRSFLPYISTKVSFHRPKHSIFFQMQFPSVKGRVLKHEVCVHVCVRACLCVCVNVLIC